MARSDCSIQPRRENPAADILCLQQAETEHSWAGEEEEKSGETSNEFSTEVFLAEYQQFVRKGKAKP